jgi:hypothetical protein
LNYDSGRTGGCVNTQPAVSFEQTFSPPLAAEAESSRIPWFLWCAVAAITSTVVGGHWDIAWHRSIGRDAFWTPPHVAIYLGGILSGIWSAYLILFRSWRKSAAERRASVRVWGFHGPLGAFISAWGGLTMIASAPFDDWWHRAYGLDVTILSPPHTVLALGIIGMQVGTLILVLGQMNRAAEDARRSLTALFLYVGGVMLMSLMVMCLEKTDRVLMHSALFYQALSICAPAVLAAIARASGFRWACTAVASVYSAFMLAFLWIFPLVPAEPKLGPVYQHVTHLIPPGFPLLLIVPAIALDLLWQKADRWKLWVLAPVSGFVFLATLLAAQWPFANFLLSPLSRNYLFGTHYLDYYVRPTAFGARNLFFPADKSLAEFWTGIAIALACAITTTAVGLASGNWMRRVRR